MCRFILSKSIKGDKANEVKNLDGISKTMWKFISTIYEAQQDNLFMNDNKIIFRNKVKLKFNP